MDQVPDLPKRILKDSWGDDFETYIIKPGEETDEVMGTVWELIPLERELVRDWELVDFGWYNDIEGKAVTKDGQEVEIQTEGFREGQEVDREVDGKNYKPFLNRLENFQESQKKREKNTSKELKCKKASSPKDWYN